MPTQKRIHSYWLESRPSESYELFNQYDIAEPSCYSCGCWSECEVWSYERAHIVDRMLDGLDIESNLVLLCRPCHKRQPIIGPDNYAHFIEWINLNRRMRNLERQLVALKVAA
jgi:5-methylcytosine-specific restriction endonuclease McrA